MRERREMNRRAEERRRSVNGGEGTHSREEPKIDTEVGTWDVIYSRQRLDGVI